MVCAGAALLMAGPASATPASYGFLELTYSSCKPAEAARTYTSYAGVGPWYAGQYNLKVNSAAGSYSTGDAGGTLWAQAEANGFVVGAYCIDIRQDAPTPGGSNPPEPFRRYDLYSLQDAPLVRGMTAAMGTTKANDLRKLFGYWNPAWSTPGYSDLNTGWSGDAYAGAFQVAVWEIVNETDMVGGAYDYNLSFGSGSFWISEYTLSGPGGWSGIAWNAQGTGWLSNLAGMTPRTDVVALVNEDFQDYALTVQGFGSGHAPEPATLAGVAMGIGCLVRYLRKRRTA
ncbi:MAG: hypothetical protein NTX87_19185 [Planctomycetota bacterium]|nr:hypothetical protein [Planctomycetota bacterium]